jgi:hypothetical protein
MTALALGEGGEPMKSVLTLWCLGILFSLVGLAALAAQEKNGAPVPLRRGVGVHKQIQAWLFINEDGSGSVGYGAGGDDQSSFKAGTFDLKRVIKQLKQLPIDKKGEWRTHYAFNFESQRKGPAEPGPLYYTRDRKLIDSLFEKAARASGGNKFQPLPKRKGPLPPNIRKLLAEPDRPAARPRD